jgi:hypothetical protein
MRTTLAAVTGQHVPLECAVLHACSTGRPVASAGGSAVCGVLEDTGAVCVAEWRSGHALGQFIKLRWTECS